MEKTIEQRLGELERLYATQMTTLASQDKELTELRKAQQEAENLREEFKAVDQRAFTAKVHADRAGEICDELRTEVIRLQGVLKSYGVSEPLKEEM
jgi:hypothetical protein